MVEHEKRATIESMVFLRDLRKRLKDDPNITLKQVKKLFEAHAEQIKKILLAQ
jgi:flagellar biosynthesis chaperone FliJ